MANLAIKGHATRGKEVIETLEMLGGKNSYDAKGDCINLLYILCDDEIQYMHYTDAKTSVMNIFTLEEFLEKFPYKVGDKVWLHYENLTIRTTETIISMRWCSKYDCVLYDVCTCCNLKEYAFTPYKEETMEEKETMKGDEGTLVAIDLTREFKKANEIEVILGDYEFVLKDGKTYFVKKIQYPKTYVECAKILESFITTYVDGYKSELLEIFQKLLICRDAYWKIAGKEMGLGKHWEPTTETVYCISRNDNVIKCSYRGGKSNILEFPTPEMRDAFYENFKDLIEQCKELL